LFIAISCSNKQDNFSYGENPAAGGFAKVNGIEMYYEIYGEGEPLLLIHGNGGNISNFSNQISFLSNYYKVIIADSRSQGKSGDNEQKLSYQLMAMDCAALLDKLELDSVYVCGWSDGGIVGIIMAINHSRKVKRLAAMGANVSSDTLAYPKYVLEFNKKALEYINKKIIEKDTSLNWQRKKKQMQLWTEINIPFQDLHKIKVPVLVMAGDKDMVREEHTIQIYQNIEKAHLCIFPGATHFIPVDDPETFNETIHRFFSKEFTRPDQEPAYNSYINNMKKCFGA
jgi:pimeloyl-ACP methyl ester carboxylesterase